MGTHTMLFTNASRNSTRVFERLMTKFLGLDKCMLLVLSSALNTYINKPYLSLDLANGHEYS